MGEFADMEAEHFIDEQMRREMEKKMNDMSKLKPTDLVARYIQLRNEKKVAEETTKAFMDENYTTPMKELELQLLDVLNELGVDSLAARGVGSCYKKITTSVTVADQREFRRHVIGEEQWDLLDWRANKTIVNELVERGEPLPPGVNRSAFYTIGIRTKS